MKSGSIENVKNPLPRVAMLLLEEVGTTLPSYFVPGFLFPLEFGCTHRSEVDSNRECKSERLSPPHLLPQGKGSRSSTIGLPLSHRAAWGVSVVWKETQQVCGRVVPCDDCEATDRAFKFKLKKSISKDSGTM